MRGKGEIIYNPCSFRFRALCRFCTVAVKGGRLGLPVVVRPGRPERGAVVDIMGQLREIVIMRSFCVASGGQMAESVRDWRSGGCCPLLTVNKEGERLRLGDSPGGREVGPG